ncbi:uncharacterized protein LOC142234719 [Haematobia irritans]|uniref:uncharacterized protein LOC142234719 n=1 Tax=Haematobia irritans TaxID=7368 RepID=UPI003F5026B7
MTYPHPIPAYIAINNTQFPNQWSQPGYQHLNRTTVQNQWNQPGLLTLNRTQFPNPWNPPIVTYPTNASKMLNQYPSNGYGGPFNKTFTLANLTYPGNGNISYLQNRTYYNGGYRMAAYKSASGYKAPQTQWNGILNQTQGQWHQYSHNAGQQPYRSRPLQSNQWPQQNHNQYLPHPNGNANQSSGPYTNPSNSHLYPILRNSGNSNPQKPMNSGHSASELPSGGNQNHLYPPLPTQRPQMPKQPTAPASQPYSAPSQVTNKPTPPQPQVPQLPSPANGQSGTPLTPSKPQGPINWQTAGPAALSYANPGPQHQALPNTGQKNSKVSPYANMVY